MSVVRTI